ncbi:MAG: hypothetical protein N2593_03605 [Patescibacteria group bacterium]|nr:hypothetical protein [Patescibacteria group bacterium]
MRKKFLKIKKAEIATFLTLGLVIAGAFLSILSSIMVSRQKNLASRPRARTINKDSTTITKNTTTITVTPLINSPTSSLDKNLNQKKCGSGYKYNCDPNDGYEPSCVTKNNGDTALAFRCCVFRSNGEIVDYGCVGTPCSKYNKSYIRACSSYNNYQSAGPGSLVTTITPTPIQSSTPNPGEEGGACLNVIRQDSFFQGGECNDSNLVCYRADLKSIGICVTPTPLLTLTTPQSGEGTTTSTTTQQPDLTGATGVPNATPTIFCSNLNISNLNIPAIDFSIVACDDTGKRCDNREISIKLTRDEEVELIRKALFGAKTLEDIRYNLTEGISFVLEAKARGLLMTTIDRFIPKWLVININGEKYTIYNPAQFAMDIQFFTRVFRNPFAPIYAGESLFLSNMNKVLFNYVNNKIEQICR